MTINAVEKPQAILFDLDGTLLDTANDLGEALNFVLRKYNFPIIARQEYRPVASDGALGLLTLGFKEQLKDFDYDVLRAEFLTYYQANIANHTCLYPGVRELLSHLNNENISWGVVTNKPEGLTNLLLPYYPEFKKCAVMVGGDTLPTRKPDPEPLFYACQQMKVEAKLTYYVGDALRDIQAGNHAGMKTYIAEWGYIKATDDLTQWQADFIIKNPQELLSIR